MTLWTYTRRGLTYYWRSHLALLLGTTIASAVLTGAFLVGDSVRFSLRQMALQRLGGVHYALSSQDRLFTAGLATNLQSQWPGAAAAVLRLNGIASRADGTARANAVQVLGVNDDFWRLAAGGAGGGSNRFRLARNAGAADVQDRVREALERVHAKPANQHVLGSDDSAAKTSATPVGAQVAPGGVVALNERLATQLRVKPGDEIILRVAKISPLSREAPIAPQEDASSALRLTVGEILGPETLGDFNLQASQVPPFNLVMPLASLQRLAGAEAQANLLLAGESSPGTDPIASTEGLQRLQSLVSNRWTLADAQLELRAFASNQLVELRTSRIFLDEPVAQAALKADPKAYGVLTYFVNELRAGDHATPYSTVCASDGPWMPDDLKEDEIMLSQWLADDLAVQPGANLELKYLVVGNRRNLEEKSAVFRVRGVLPMTLPSADPNLMPDFPGLSKAENCRDWDAGFAIQLDKIRPQDQAYWDQHRGTPKAFIRLAAGQRLWSSRFGSLTAVRYPLSSSNSVAGELRGRLDPAQFSLVFLPVRAEALAASVQGQDFGQLFLGFSFFVLIAALILAVMLFHFGVEQRAAEIGLLLAVGMRPGRVRRLLLFEGACVGVAGSALGLVGGDYYAQLMVGGLTTIWREAVNTSALQYHGTVQAWALGGVVSVAISIATLWNAARQHVRRPAHWLLTAGREMTGASPRGAAGSRRSFWVAGICGALALLSVVAGELDAALSAPMFFLAGAGVLAACLAGFGGALRRVSTRSTVPSLMAIGLKNMTRRRRRSMSVAAMLAMGTFIVVGVGVNRLEADRDAFARSSGTGGFALLGQSALPIVHDLNSKAGRDFLSLDDTVLKGTRFVPFRVREGDDASCLNLNRAQRPRLLGVNPRELAERRAFAFSSVPKGTAPADAWRALERVEADGTIPAIGDQASIQWALGKSVGDTMALEDENGKTYRIRFVGAVANSILQGNLIISESAFLAKYPSENGSRWFLIDAPEGQSEPVARHLSRALQDYGFEASSTVARLAMLNAVQNTYISTFQVLGGFGLLIGSVGMGLVVARNVLERRAELALLHALGYRARQIRAIVLWEHAGLFLAGTGIGLVSALVAVVPAWSGGHGTASYRIVTLLLAAVVASGFLWTWLAARLALRQDWLAVLREE